MYWVANWLSLWSLIPTGEAGRCLAGADAVARRECQGSCVVIPLFLRETSSPCRGLVFVISLNFLRYSFSARFALSVDVGRDVGNVVGQELVLSSSSCRLLSVLLHIMRIPVKRLDC